MILSIRRIPNSLRNRSSQVPKVRLLVSVCGIPPDDENAGCCFARPKAKVRNCGGDLDNLISEGELSQKWRKRGSAASGIIALFLIWDL